MLLNNSSIQEKNGTGIIATISFEKLQDGPSTIDFEKAKLVASTLQEIPNQTNFLEIGNQSQHEVNSPTGEGELSPVVIKTSESNTSETIFTPWLVAGGAVILAIIGLGVLFVLGSVALFGRRPYPATRRSPKGKSTPQIWLRPISNIRIQRPQLRPSRRSINTRSD